MIRRVRRLLRAPEPDDIIVGDFVTRGFGPSGIVESIEGDHATIAFDKDQRDILPLACLNRVPQRGSSFDSRRGR